MNILLGVTGGIAAYKAADLTSMLVKNGHAVRVVMTPSATHFVGKVTFEALSKSPVLTDTFETGTDNTGLSSVRHIDWAKWADVSCIAPCTASTLGKLAQGIADNALTTVWLAIPPQKRQWICPAMNTQMWLHPSVQRNATWLAESGRYQFVNPVEKRLACGDIGVGGLAEVADIFEAITTP